MLAPGSLPPSPAPAPLPSAPLPSSLPVRLLSVATAVPPFPLSQADARDTARAVFADRVRDFDRLAPVFANAGIAQRYSCVPLDWYRQSHGWAERNRLYLEHAVDSLEQATLTALERAGLHVGDIDAIVAVSSTGIATPSLDARIMQRLRLRPDTQRLPIFGLGCAGGVPGFARASAWARAMPGRTILLLVVELCGLSFRRDDFSSANVVASALFGDGAAAVLLRAEPEAAPPTLQAPPILQDWSEHCWPDTLGIMGWQVEDDGLGVIFSQSIPTLVRREFPALITPFLARHHLHLEDLSGVICHPGGAKVLDALQEVLAPCTAGLDDARTILSQYGNMSAVTVLFVLERRLARGAYGPHLMTALGPGFTAALALLTL